jgi:hypothetical protein
MTATTRRHASQTDPEPPTPGGASTRTYPPCVDCGFDEWGTYDRADSRSYPWLGRCPRCYQAAKRRAAGVPTRDDWRASFRPPDGPNLGPRSLDDLWPDRSLPVWTGLALAKYDAPAWHTYRPEDRQRSRIDWERQLGRAA